MGGRTSTTWQAGQTGRPENRPRPTTWRAFRDRLRAASDDAAAELVERIRLSREATERVSAAARRLADDPSDEDALAELQAALHLQTKVRDLVALLDLWLGYAWGKPTAVAMDGDVPADLAQRPAAEQLMWLEEQAARYGQAIANLRSRHRNIEAHPAASAVKLAQEEAADALVAEREARH